MPIYIDRTVNEVYPVDQEQPGAGEAGDSRWQQQEHWRAQMQQFERQQARVSATDFED